MERTLAVTVASLLLVMTLILGLFALNGRFSPKQETLTSQSGVAAEEPAPTMTLGVYQGKLALFLGDGRYPNEIYNVRVRSLPPEDREKLAEGLSVSSEAELLRLLEDYSS